MQAGTVSRLWLQSTSGRTLCIFGSHTFVPTNWMCKETNCCFTQYNRIWNHLCGHWTGIRWFACSGTVGSDCFCSWKCSWGQWSCNQDDHLREESYNETCFQNPQNCSCLVVWSNQSGFQNPNQIHRHQKPTRRHLNQRKFHTWWVESFVELVQHQPFQLYNFALLQWRNEFNKNQEKNESQPNQDPWWISLRGRVVFNFIKPGEETGRILGNLLLQMIDQGNLIDSPQQVIQKRIMTVLGLLKSGKVELRRTIDQGNLIKLLGMRCNKFVLIMETPLLDGDAQSVRYGWRLRDRSGQPDSANSQGRLRNFRHGSWRSRICEQSKRSSAKKTEKNAERCRFWRRAFNNMGNVHGCDDECGDIHGKEFLNCSKHHHEFWRSHFEADVRCHRAIGEPERTLARVCREAGATMRWQAKLRDMNVTVSASDERAIEVLASGLPLFQGAQLAIDITIRNIPSSATVPNTSHTDGVVLLQTRRE